MEITIPIYIEEQNAVEQGGFVVRPLFFTEPSVRDENLNRAVTRLVKLLRRQLGELGRQPRHHYLSFYSFSPETEDHLYKFDIELSERRYNCKFLIVTFEALGRRIAFAPGIDDLWFDIERGETLEQRAGEALAKHFREREKKEGRAMITPDALSVKGKAWVTTVDLEIYPPKMAIKSEESLMAMLGGKQILDGESELNQVGRCLDWLFPEELDRAICREQEVEELTAMLTSPDRRPVLIVGPRLVGKTALIHEYVYRTVEKRRTIYATQNNVWLLSPGRLISGMSYVGQWENRLLAIMKEAQKRNHILYFDDLLGLFHAGITRDSNLSALHVLKPWVEKREFRLLGEITPEALRVFQEQDRGFADQFQIMPVKEPAEAQTWSILISLMRHMERQHGCIFDIDVLPTVMDIQRRYVRDAVFPGKAAGFVRQLAVKFRSTAIYRGNVFSEFQAKSGLSVSLLDNTKRLERKQIVEALSREVIGQPAAVDACADIITIAKARLNDAERPLASILFLGPTGVGKTQCAKSLAAYLYGDANRIVRFDMNEFISPAAVSRLVGTFDQPEGLLTSAIRRQPFAVLLLDEIEKANPDLFNLLLQVMGDGRLTDALGRTVDFTNTILIMTSNLGVKEASGQLGFRQGEQSDAQVFVSAAEKFFRPEFFNRLDRIIPFERLRREDVSNIAQLLIKGVFSREGLARRRCLLHVETAAMERIVDQGYHPHLGARALKRAIERQLTQPVAARLASMAPGTPAIVTIYPNGASVAVHTEELAQAAWREPPLIINGGDGKAVIAIIDKYIERVAEEIEGSRPPTAFTTDDVSSEQFRYYIIKEQMQRVEKMSRWLFGRLSGSKPISIVPGALPRRRSQPAKQTQTRAATIKSVAAPIAPDLIAAVDLRARLSEMAFAAGQKIEDDIAELVRETALLHTLVNAPDESANVLINIRVLERDGSSVVDTLLSLYDKLFNRELGLSANVVDDKGAIIVTGPHALALAGAESGTHLFINADGSFKPVQVYVSPLAVNEKIAGRLAESERSQLQPPPPLHPIIRIYDEQVGTLDLRTGLLTARMLTAGELRAFILAMLPLPAEIY